MKGEGAFTRIEHIDTMKDSEIIALFNQQRANDYAFTGSAGRHRKEAGSIQKGAKARI